MKTTRERQQERRDEKLADVRRAQESGSLVIRQMTAEERAGDPRTTAAEPAVVPPTGSRSAA
jgi:hypothetical protein